MRGDMGHIDSLENLSWNIVYRGAQFLQAEMMLQ